MARTRVKSKGRRETGLFIALPTHIFTSPQYANLSAHAVKLLIDLLSQYRGFNNGDLCATWSLMSQRGWRSRDTLNRALKELMTAGFIEKTRQGERGHSSGQRKPTLYGVTWKGIDECGGKLDVSPNPVPSNRWAKITCTARVPCQSNTATVLKLVSGGVK